MKQKTRLLMTIISMCLVITLGVIGILAVKKLDLNIGGNVSFTAEGVDITIENGAFTVKGGTGEMSGTVGSADVVINGNPVKLSIPVKEYNGKVCCWKKGIIRRKIMPKKQRKFADDGWAVWIDGEDVSTVYINHWLNPKGKSYVDISVRVYGAKETKTVNFFIPFAVEKSEITDLSYMLAGGSTLRALFNANGKVDSEKTKYTSELSYDNRTVSLINLSDEYISLNLAGEPLAAYLTGDIFEGTGNMEMAYRMYNAIAHENDAHGLKCYADMLFTGRGVEKDVQGALRMYQMSAEQGDRAAMFVIGEFTKTQNPNLAAYWYGVAHSRGYQHALQRLIQLANK